MTYTTTRVEGSGGLAPHGSSCYNRRETRPNQRTMNFVEAISFRQSCLKLLPYFLFSATDSRINFRRGQGDAAQARSPGRWCILGVSPVVEVSGAPEIERTGGSAPDRPAFAVLQ